MSLSSKKSKGYNRGACKVATNRLMAQQLDGTNYDEHDFDSYMRCDCSDCEYDLGRNYRAVLVAKLEKLKIISKEIANNFWFTY